MNDELGFFDFYSEIKKDKNYQLLYPDKKVGLAIIWLYQRILDDTFPSKTFKESDIHEALDKVNPTSTKEDHRRPTDHYNIIVSELQEYFIRYDQEREVYLFKEYGNEFCKQALNTLRSNFDPTQNEKICIDPKEDIRHQH